MNLKNILKKRNMGKLELRANEEIILVDRGFYKKDPRSDWKPGRLYLTDTRLFLWQPLGIIFQMLLEYIEGVSIQQKDFILRGKDVLCVSCKKPGNEEQSQAWIMVKDLETWKDRISELKQEKPEVSDQRESREVPSEARGAESRDEQEEPAPPRPTPKKWQGPEEVFRKLFGQSA